MNQTEEFKKKHTENFGSTQMPDYDNALKKILKTYQAKVCHILIFFFTRSSFTYITAQGSRSLRYRPNELGRTCDYEPSNSL